MHFLLLYLLPVIPGTLHGLDIPQNNPTFISSQKKSLLAPVPGNFSVGVVDDIPRCIGRAEGYYPVDIKDCQPLFRVWKRRRDYLIPRTWRAEGMPKELESRNAPKCSARLSAGGFFDEEDFSYADMEIKATEILEVCSTKKGQPGLGGYDGVGISKDFYIEILGKNSGEALAVTPSID